MDCDRVLCMSGPHFQMIPLRSPHSLCFYALQQSSCLALLTHTTGRLLHCLAQLIQDPFLAYPQNAMH